MLLALGSWLLALSQVVEVVESVEVVGSKYWGSTNNG
jgi:hypothetical protein